MRTFTVYRKGDLSATHNANQVNAPDEPQFEGVIFSDGRCALRWLTACRSVSVWDSVEDAFKVHGHPEERYGTSIVWHDSTVDLDGFHERLRAFIAEYGPSMGDDQTADFARKLIYGTYNRDAIAENPVLQLFAERMAQI